MRRIRLGHAPNCSSLGNVLNVLVWTQAAVGALWVASEAWVARRKRPGGAQIAEPPAVLIDGEPGTVEAHVQVTTACALPCPTCHVDPRADGTHVPLDVLDARFADLARRGVFHVAIGGGESLRHPDLPAIADLAHRHGLTIGLTTSGVGLRDARALAAFDQVNVSLDGVGAVYAEARGYDGGALALAAIRALSAQVRVGVNVVLDRNTFPHLGETAGAAVEAGARDVHLLRLKPAGRGTRDYLDRRLTPAQAREVWPAAVALMERHPDVTVRADCAMLPLLAAHGLDPERMRAFLFFGCHGGDALVSVDAAGGEHPCSFARGPADARWKTGVLGEPCGSCAYRDLCRGGCHAVAEHLTGDRFAPDPECPMVAS
ncbi:MAG: radical SAM/SPASM domain-containing protein [Myxococcota bacterium]